MSEEDYEESEFNESDLDDIPLMLDYPHQYEDQDDDFDEDEDLMPPPPKPPSFSLGLSLNRVQATEDDSQPPMTRRGGPETSIGPAAVPPPLKLPMQAPPKPPQPFALPTLAIKQLNLSKEGFNGAVDQPTTRPHRKGEEERDAVTSNSEHSPSLSLFTSLRQPLSLSDVISRTLGPSLIPAQQDRVLVSLLSPAMALPISLPLPPSSSSSASPSHSRPDEANNSSEELSVNISEAILSRMASALLLPKSSLRCFTLSETSWDQLHLSTSASASASASSPPTQPTPSLSPSPSQAIDPSAKITRHVAVLVESSSFSLPALEDLLRQNRQLMAAQSENAKTIGSLQSDCRQAMAHSESEALKALTMVKDLELLRASVARLEADKEELRGQLRRCDEQRLLLKNTLTEIRREFSQQSQTMS